MEDITHVGRYMYMVKITITTLTASQGGGISARTLALARPGVTTPLFETCNITV